jgi:uncharacterized cupin superfamily protein
MGAAPVNWDDVPVRQVAMGPLEGVWRDLGTAAGTQQVGLKRMQVAPGKRSTPAHTHSGEEEIFFVLAGSGLSWQAGATYDIVAGDCLVHLCEGPAHTLVAGPDGLDVLVFGERTESEACYLPRAGVSWLGSSWVRSGETDHPFVQEAAAGELKMPAAPSERPASIVNIADVPQQVIERGEVASTRRSVSEAAGAVRTALREFVLPPGKMGVPPHCHSGAEELFVVLEGAGAYLEGEPGATGWEPEERPVRSGDVVAVLAGTGEAHAFRAGLAGLTYLAYGNRDRHDTIWYPRSRKIAFPGLKVISRVEPLGYWDGEETGDAAASATEAEH